MPLSEHSNSSLIKEAVYAMGELAGDPRANALYVEPYKEEVARRVPSCVSVQEYSCAVCAWILYLKISCVIIYAFVT